MIEYINGTGTVPFIFICLFLISGLFINQIKGKGDTNYICLIFICVLIVLIKISSSIEISSDRYFLHLNQLLAFPLSFSLISLVRRLSIRKKTLNWLCYFFILFQLCSIPKFHLLNTVIPGYSTTFSLALGLTGFFGIWLIHLRTYQIRAYFIIVISSISILLSLAKWLLLLVPIYIFLVYKYGFYKFSLGAKAVIYIFIMCIISFGAYILKDKIIRNFSSFSSFNSYVARRITKEMQVKQWEGEEVFHQIGGIGDGGRFFLWRYQIREWYDKSLFFGLNLNFENPQAVPEHNIFVTYITRLGLFSLLPFYLIKIYIFDKRTSINPYSIAIYNSLMLYIFLLFCVGGWYGVPRACFMFALLMGLMQNRSFAVS